MSQLQDTPSIYRDIVDERTGIGIKDVETHLGSLDGRKTHDALIAYRRTPAYFLPLPGIGQLTFYAECLHSLAQRDVLLHHHGTYLSVPTEIHGE